MNYIDFIILGAGIVAFLLGFKDGFVRKLIGTIGFFLAVLLGIKLSRFGATALMAVFDMERSFAEISGGFLIFVAIMVITAILKRIIHPFDKVNNMINRIVGGIAGVLQIIVFLSAFFFILNIFKLPGKEVRAKSLFYSSVAAVLPQVIDILEKVTPHAKDSIKDIMKEKDSI